MEEKLKKILELQDQGIERRKISELMGYARLDSMTKWMRSRGYIIENDRYKLEGDNSQPSVLHNTGATQIDDESAYTKEHTHDIQTVRGTGIDNVMELVLNQDKSKDILIDLICNYEKIKEMMEWFDNRQADQEVIEVRSGLHFDLDDSTVRKSFWVNQTVWTEFDQFAEQHKEFTKKDLLSMAIKEYIERHR
jgi:hypothetical protein